MDRLRDLMAEWAEVENEIKTLQERMDIVKDEVRKIVEASPDKLIETDHGVLMMTKASKTVKYDAKQIDSLIAELIKNGEVHTANLLSNIREESVRKSYLMYRKVV